MPDWKSTPVKLQLFHQSQATLPGRIHDKSLMRHSGANRWAISQFKMSASRSVMTTARQGSDCLGFSFAI